MTNLCGDITISSNVHKRILPIRFNNVVGIRLDGEKKIEGGCKTIKEFEYPIIDFFLLGYN